MMNYLIFAATWLLAVSGHVFAQHQEISEKPKMWKGKESTTSDSLTLLNVFRTGHFEGHFRYFFMVCFRSKSSPSARYDFCGGWLQNGSCHSSTTGS